MPPTHPAELLRAKLKLKQLQAHREFRKSLPHVKSPLALDRLHSAPSQLLATTAITGALLLAPPSSFKSLPERTQEERISLALATKSSTHDWLISRLGFLASLPPGHLSPGKELEVSLLLRSAYGINALPILENQRLNFSLGFTGYEQHLKRFPGDTLSQHDDEQIAGIAPGLGGWGYFASSQSSLSSLDILREKYYFAVQTLYLPDWNTNTQQLSRWYKYRKMIMVNPQNGKAVVGVIADAGPARWTGKQFGASPEAMKALDLHLGPRKGKVLLYFVDDPGNSVPLGPLEHHLGQSPPILT